MPSAISTPGRSLRISTSIDPEGASEVEECGDVASAASQYGSGRKASFGFIAIVSVHQPSSQRCAGSVLKRQVRCGPAMTLR